MGEFSLVGCADGNCSASLRRGNGSWKASGQHGAFAQKRKSPDGQFADP